MKKRFSTRLLSFFMAILMVVTMVPLGAISAYAATDSEIAALKNAMTAYENKMDGTVYTNMSAAYNAYVEANKAYDAAYYGKTGDVTTATTTLVNATAAMTAWTWSSQEWTSDYGSFGEDNTSDWGSGKSYQYYNKNVLYGEKGNTGDRTSNDMSSSKQMKFYMCYPAMTLVYDGSDTELKTAITVRGVKTDKERHMYVAELLNSDLKLASSSVWYGTDNKNNWVWLYSTEQNNQNSSWGTVYGGQIGTDSVHTKDSRLQNNNTYYTWANMLVFNGSFAENEYIKEVYPQVKMYAGSSKTVNLNDITCTLTGSEPIRYINYKALIDTTAAATVGKTNVADYRTGGLTTYFSNFDEYTTRATNFNLDNYRSASDYTACANEIKYICNGFKLIGSTAGAVDADGYKNLRTAFETREMTAAGSAFTVMELGELANPGFTAESWDNFQSEYSNAKGVMANVIVNGYNSADGANNAASKLLTAFRALEKDEAAQPPEVTGQLYFDLNDTNINVNIKPIANDKDTTYTVTYTYPNGATKTTDSVTLLTAGADIPAEGFYVSLDTTNDPVKAVITAKTGDASTFKSVYFPTAPTMDKADKAVLTNSDTVKLTTTTVVAGDDNVIDSDTNYTHAFQYSYVSEGGYAWNTYTSAGIPLFQNGEAVQDVYVREVMFVDGNPTPVAGSVVAHALYIREVSFGIYMTDAEGNGSGEHYDPAGNLVIENLTPSYTGNIAFEVEYMWDDGSTSTKLYTYTDTTGEGMSLSTIQGVKIGKKLYGFDDAKAVSIKAYADAFVQDGEVVDYALCTTALFINVNEKAAEKDKYVFTYFTGNSDVGETLHMAISDDGYNWEALNGGNPIWNASNVSSLQVYPNNSGKVATSGHVRDPYAFQAEDGSFYVLSTDLNTVNGTNWGNNSKLLVWHMDSMSQLGDTEPWVIDTQSIVNNAGILTGDVSRAWAPEAIYDAQVGHYMLFWAVGYVGGKTYMYYMYTDDFKSFFSIDGNGQVEATCTPKRLTTDTNDNIDGNITYYNGLYYLWYKNETTKTIGYATSTNCAGPYSNFKQFKNVEGGSFEGPEVYYLYSTGQFMLMADLYNSDLSFFSTYNAYTPDDFENNNASGMNLNYLRPRHGSVTAITTAEYNKLIEKYGKVTFDSTGKNTYDLATGIATEHDANDYLVARYFTNDDANYDATGHGYTLTSNAVNMTTYNGRVAAQFNGSAKDNTGNNAATTTSDSYSYQTNGKSYATVDTTAMMQGITAKEGVTFSWYGYATNANGGRWFDWSDASSAGSLSWDRAYADTDSQRDKSYIYAASNTEFGVNHSDHRGNYSTTIADGYKGTAYKGAWHLYTLTVSNGYITLCVDGALLKYEYSKDGLTVTKQGSPINNTNINEAFFSNIMSNLYFGVSSYAADEMLNGYISDFRIYNKALSYFDIEESILSLETEIPGKDLTDEKPVYYDPMENMAAADSKDGLAKTAYPATVVDDTHKNVLNTANGVTSHNPGTYSGSLTTANNGYTISTWYNPGSSIDGNKTIFQIGAANTGNDKTYIELLENGQLFYCWGTDAGDASKQAYIDAGNILGTLPTNTWSYITIQIVPDGSYDKIYAYVDGQLVSKTDYFTTSASKRLMQGYSLHDYMAKDHEIRFGAGCGHWNGDSATVAYADEFTIYNDVISAKSLYKDACLDIADTLLPIANADYAAKMAELEGADYVFTNMADAYDAYDRVQRFLDAQKYAGYEPTQEEIVALYTELEDAIDAMQPYTKPETVQGYGDAGKNFVDEKFTHNMITQPTGLYIMTENEEATDDNHNSRISSSAFTWLYTGFANDIPVAPMNAGNYASATTHDYRANSIYINNSVPMKFGGLGLTTDDTMWHQNTTNLDAAGTSNNINWNINNYSHKFYASDTIANDAANRGIKMNTARSWYNSSQYASFTGNAATFTATEAGATTYTDPETGAITNYIISFTPQYAEKTYYYTIFENGICTSCPHILSSGTVNVINYAPVYKELTDADRLDMLANITKYSPASCMELLKAYDALTNQSYLLASNVKATDLAMTIKTEVDTLMGINLEEIEQKADPTEVIETKEAEDEFYNAVKSTDSGIGEVELVDGEYVQVENMDGTDAQYTQSSWAAYEKAHDAITAYYASINPYTDDNPYATKQQDLDNLKLHIESAKAHLNVVADYSGVDAIVVEEQIVDDKNCGNYDNENNQIYTATSYINFVDAYDVANGWASKDTAYRADTEKYAVEYTQAGVDGKLEQNCPYVAFDENDNLVTSDDQTPYRYQYVGVFYDEADDVEPSQFETGDYVMIGGALVQLNGHRYAPGTVQNGTSGEAVFSNRQAEIYDATDDLQAKDDALVPVDNAAAYDTFDSAYKVVSTFDSIKYVDPATVQAGIDSYDDQVYLTLTGDALTKYNNATGKNFPENTKICNTTQGQTDSITAGLLAFNTSINDVNDSSNTYIKRFDALFTVQRGDNVISTTEYNDYAYGTSFPTFSKPAVTDDEYVTWTITTYEYGTDMSNLDSATPTGSQKIAVDTDLTRIADANVAICAKINEGETSSATYKVNIYNVYNQVTSVVYTNTDLSEINDSTSRTITINGTDITADSVPFYSFSRWEVLPDGTTINVKPKYVVDDSVTITVTDGAIVGGTDDSIAVKENELVTLDGASVENFYAWASYSYDSMTYSVASYDKVYDFYAVTNEKFVPITLVDGTYYINGVEVTAAMLGMGANATSFDYTAYGITLDEYAIAKLDQKAPFISIVKTERDAGKSRAYVRATGGVDATYGALLSKTSVNPADMSYRGITNVLDTNQFTISVTTSGAVNIGTLVSYDFNIEITNPETAATATTALSVSDFSSVSQINA